MALTDWTTEILAPAAAIKRVRRLGRGRKVFVHVHQNARIENDPDHTYSVGAGVYIGRTAGIKFIEDAYGGVMASRGALVRISYCENVLFIG